MGSRRRYAFIGVLLLTLVVAFVLSRATHWLLGYVGLQDVLLGGLKELPVSTVFSYTLMLGVFIGIFKNKTSAALVYEIVDELLRVNWPSKAVVWRGTLIVIGTVAFSAIYLGLLDATWLWLTDWLLGISTKS